MINNLKYQIIRGRLTKEKGFTLIEVLAGILILSAFALAGLQALAIATQMKVAAEKKSRANSWIEENIEQAKFWASQYGETSTFEDYAEDNWSTYINDANSLDWQGNNLCNPVDNGNGFGTLLKSFLASSNGYDSNTAITINGLDDNNDGNNDTYYQIDTNTFLGNDFLLLYRPQISNDYPFSILGVTYIVLKSKDVINSNANEDDLITRSDTEIIPDAAFQC